MEEIPSCCHKLLLLVMTELSFLFQLPLQNSNTQIIAFSCCGSSSSGWKGILERNQQVIELLTHFLILFVPNPHSMFIKPEIPHHVTPASVTSEVKHVCSTRGSAFFFLLRHLYSTELCVVVCVCGGFFFFTLRIVTTFPV